MTTPSRPRLLHRALVANLALEILIVVTGGTVRVTRSGLGCPTWPRCTPDSFVPVADQAEGFHRIIEYGNRLLTPVVGIAALVVIIAVWRFAPERRDLRRLSVLPLVGVLLQAVVGGITVRVKLSPYAVMAHFLASMVLVALSAYLLVRARQPAAGRRRFVRREVGWGAWATSGTAVVILVLGTVVTGTGPHSGDRQTHRFLLDPRTVSWLHADAVMLFLGLVVAMWLAVRLTSAEPDPHRAWATVLFVTLAQGVVGYTQYFLKLPEALVVLHMLGASLLVAALTWGVLSLRVPADDPARTPSTD